jgi:NADP-dependent 3-hydroxy acid dehydrogenase YdfG
MDNYYIFGGSRGIGFEVAKYYAMMGKKVKTISRYNSDLEIVLGGNTNFEHCKIQDYDRNSIRKIFEKSDMESLSIIIASGGIDEVGTINDLSEGAWLQAIKVNVMIYVNIYNVIFKKEPCNQINIYCLGTKKVQDFGEYNIHYTVSKMMLSTIVQNNNDKNIKIKTFVIDLPKVFNEGFVSNIEKFNQKYGTNNKPLDVFFAGQESKGNVYDSIKAAEDICRYIEITQSQI